MHIDTAEFVISNTDIKKCPESTLPEYAFIGRSNVGKSSLINMLTQRKTLAKTSGRPGKTQLINHFLINKTWYLVDLPGYGYAKVSKSAKQTFVKLITDYIELRPNLTNLFVLIDIRLEPQKIDLEFIEYLGEHGIPFSLVFTKADKIGKSQRQKSIARFRRKMLEKWEEMPVQFLTSAEERIGRDEVLSYISSINLKLEVK